MSVLRNTHVQGSCEGFVPGFNQQQADEGLQNDGTSIQTKTPSAKPFTLQQIEQGLLSLTPEEVKQLLSKHFAAELESIKEDTQTYALAKAEQEITSQKQRVESELENQKKQLADSQKDLNVAVEFWLEKVAQEASESKTDTFSHDLFIQLFYKALTQVISIEVEDKRFIHDLIKQLSDDYKQESVCRLFISEYHHQQITSYLDQQGQSLPWEILIAPDLIPGNYRLEFVKGSLEQDLMHSLTTLKESLLSLSVPDGEQQ